MNTVVDRAMKIEGATLPIELIFLHELASKAEGVCVELGTYYGRSALVIADAAWRRGGRTVSIDRYTPEPWAPKKRTMVDVIMGLGDTKELTLVHGDTRVVPPFVDKIGFLFIDSEHTRVQFDAEMAVWLPRLLPGGIVACHDYDSPTYLEMNAAIDHHFRTWEFLGQRRHVVAYRSER